jgi:hypothetical protein
VKVRPAAAADSTKIGSGAAGRPAPAIAHIAAIAAATAPPAEKGYGPFSVTKDPAEGRMVI